MAFGPKAFITYTFVNILTRRVFARGVVTGVVVIRSGAVDTFSAIMLAADFCAVAKKIAIVQRVQTTADKPFIAI